MGIGKTTPKGGKGEMRRGLQTGEAVVEDKGAVRREPGSAEVIPQAGMIDGQRQEVGKNTVGRRGV